MSDWISFGLAMVVAAASAAPAARLLRRAGATAHPTARSSHTTPTVSGAGVAIVAGTVVGVLAAVDRVDALVGVILAVATGLAVVGLVDDVRPLSARVRLAVQALGAMIGVGAVAVAVATPPWAILVVPVVAVGVAWTTNAVNFMDGIDGITTLHGVVFGVVVGVSAPSAGLSALGWSLAAAGVGYLPFNFPRASSFPGDAGAYFIGMLVPLALVAGVAEEPRTVVALGTLVPYMTDTVVTVLSRLRAGEDVAAPHRNHTYQRLARRTGSHTVATCTFVGLSLVSSVPALVLPWWDPLPFTPLVPVAAAAILALRAWLPDGPDATARSTER